VGDQPRRVRLVIKLIAMLKRKPGMTEEEFHAHWRDVHGPLVMSTKSGQHALRYEQNHRVAGDLRHVGLADGYDGVTVQWYDSVESFRASQQEPDFALIAEDMAKFLDLDALVWLLTEEPEIVADTLR
jgi:uncharacterized protein (TIGR02118 family)